MERSATTLRNKGLQGTEVGKHDLFCISCHKMQVGLNLNSLYFHLQHCALRVHFPSHWMCRCRMPWGPSAVFCSSDVVWNLHSDYCIVHLATSSDIGVGSFSVLFRGVWWKKLHFKKLSVCAFQKLKLLMIVWIYNGRSLSTCWSA